MNISSTWTGLDNPELDPEQVDGGMESLQEHPSTKLKRLGDKTGKSEEGWATVRIDGRDWGKVMSVGRLGADKVIACIHYVQIRCSGQIANPNLGFCHDHALILYVFMSADERDNEGSVLTVSILQAVLEAGLIICSTTSVRIALEMASRESKPMNSDRLPSTFRFDRDNRAHHSVAAQT
jgi:hypothetical protein